MVLDKRLHIGWLVGTVGAGPFGRLRAIATIIKKKERTPSLAFLLSMVNISPSSLLAPVAIVSGVYKTYDDEEHFCFYAILAHGILTLWPGDAFSEK